MRQAAFSIFFVFAFLQSTAQDSIILRHDNGVPALSGPCTFFVNPYTSADLMRTMHFGREERRIRHDFGDGFRDAVSDADGYHDRPLDHKQSAVMATLGLSCDGQVRTYCRNGAKRAEMNFRAGIPTGRYTEFCAEGGERGVEIFLEKSFEKRAELSAGLFFESLRP